jgi:hypothetical protein
METHLYIKSNKISTITQQGKEQNKNQSGIQRMGPRRRSHSHRRLRCHDASPHLRDTVFYTLDIYLVVHNNDHTTYENMVMSQSSRSRSKRNKGYLPLYKDILNSALDTLENIILTSHYGVIFRGLKVLQ